MGGCEMSAIMKRGHRSAKPKGAFPRFYGRHAVIAALANPNRIVRKIWGTREALAPLDLPPVLPIVYADVADMGRMVPSDAPHQGIVAEVEPLDDVWLDEVLEQGRDDKRPILVLDQVTDPHNVGAILRSAAVFGATGLVMTRRHSPPLDGALAKAASGALELVPIALVQNLSRALAELGKLEVQRIGLDGEAATLIEDQPLAGAVALVLGAEGKGLRELTRETCDHLVRIGNAGPLASLNVSNAAAVALHMAALQRRR